MIVTTNARIQQLPSSVVEKIAAGEVIERPASVVKELIENALDADANRIDCIIEDAGFSSITIIDNGCGMGPQDLQKCLLPHTTSKITTADDLFAISTMGFRGEALASIAAISRVLVSCSETQDGLGYSLTAEGGSLLSLTQSPRVRGTTIVCKDLFYNVPARKKFMKSHRAEQMSLHRCIEQLTVAFPDVHFTYTIDGKRIYDIPQVDTLQKRIAQLSGTEFTKKLIRCIDDTTDMTVDIYISDPQDATARPRFQSLYVNRRRVDNDSVMYAIREAFSRFITSQLKASWFCFLTVNPSRVDVNVHPTKQKIKFDNEKGLFSFIFRTVHTAISQQIGVTDKLAFTTEESPRTYTNTVLSPIPDHSKAEVPQYGSDRGPVMDKSVPSVFGISSVPVHKENSESQQTSLSLMAVFNDKGFIEKEIVKGSDKGVELSKESWNLIPCYQIHRMYILAPIKNGIIIIDQHAAHERILFEEAVEDISRGRSESQRLLFPITFSMSAAEKEIVIASRDYFTSLGFDVQDFGGLTIAVSAMPATGFMKSSTVEEAIREMVVHLIEEKDKTLLSQPQKRFAASFACGAAIKAGQELKQEEMNLLLNSLFATQNPYICPHGRPTLVRISLDEMARRFLR